MDIQKSHLNEAIVITDLVVNLGDCYIKQWTIKPIRRKSKANIEELNIVTYYGDLIKYIGFKKVV